MTIASRCRKAVTSTVPQTGCSRLARKTQRPDA
jgi:hypothetical protein